MLTWILIREKKRIEQGVFNTCSKPIGTASERIFNETGRILEARRQLLIPESLDPLIFLRNFRWLFFCDCLIMKLDLWNKVWNWYYAKLLAGCLIPVNGCRVGSGSRMKERVPVGSARRKVYPCSTLVWIEYNNKI